jgi:hypothetical protein
MNTPMPPDANFIVQPWRKSYEGGYNIKFNPLLSTLKQSAGKRIILFVHTGKCAGESILEGMARIFGAKVLIYEYHVFDANERLLEALNYFHGNKPELASIVVATRDPLSRWVSSYNWDLHNLFLSKNKQPPEGFSAYPDVNMLANGIMNCESLAMRFGKFGHMGMGVSWYLPIDVHSLLDPQRTFILRTEQLDSDFHVFVNRYCNQCGLQIRSMDDRIDALSRTKHDFQSSYPENTFQRFDYSNTEVTDAMHKYLRHDIAANRSLIKTFSCERSA